MTGQGRHWRCSQLRSRAVLMPAARYLGPAQRDTFVSILGGPTTHCKIMEIST